MKVTILVQSMFLGILGTCKSIETLSQHSSLIILTVYLIETVNYLATFSLLELTDETFY